MRQRSLQIEFNEYAASTGRPRQFRTEAVRAGFAGCIKRQDYPTLIKVAERLPEDVLREDPDLLMYYDSSLLRKKYMYKNIPTGIKGILEQTDTLSPVSPSSLLKSFYQKSSSSLLDYPKEKTCSTQN